MSVRSRVIEIPLVIAIGHERAEFFALVTLDRAEHVEKFLADGARHKSGSGREVMIAVTVWDDQPARLQALADEVEAKAGAIGGTSEWHLVSLVLVRRRTIRDVAGPWATAVDFRARLLAA